MSKTLLQGRNVFLTGGSRGIGRDAVIELVRWGANVAFTYMQNIDAARETMRLAQEIAPNAEIKAYKMDVRHTEQVGNAAQAAIDDFGSINVVVNNAGNLSDSLVYNMTDSQWFDVINTHLTGTFYVCREFLGEFIYNGGGTFINTSSIAYTGSAGQSNYSAAKAGIIGLSRALAKEYGKKQIYTNVVIPGYFDTELTRGNATEVVVDNFVRLSSLKRPGQGGEYGKVVVFLASELASFVNGEVIHVTGGLESIPPI